MLYSKEFLENESNNINKLVEEILLYFSKHNHLIYKKESDFVYSYEFITNPLPVEESFLIDRLDCLLDMLNTNFDIISALSL